jgi:hypothetical protein
VELVQEGRIVTALDVADVVHVFDGALNVLVEMSNAAKFWFVFRVADRVRPGANVIKLFSSLLTVEQNKLGCSFRLV